MMVEKQITQSHAPSELNGNFANLRMCCGCLLIFEKSYAFGILVQHTWIVVEDGLCGSFCRCFTHLYKSTLPLSLTVWGGAMKVEKKLNCGLNGQ